MSIDEERIQFLIRCRFNGFCKKVIRNAAASMKRKNMNRWKREFYFEDLSPAEQERLQVIDNLLEDETRHYLVSGKTFSEGLIHKAIASLPDNKRTVINLYFFDNLTEEEIADLLELSRGAVWYRKNSSLKKLEKYLEEHAHNKEE